MREKHNKLKTMNTLRTECIGMDIQTKQFFFEEMLRFRVIFMEESFKSSAGFSLPFYGDFRRLISSPHLLGWVGSELGKAASKLGADILASASMSADAWTATASLYSTIPCVILRKEPHNHGDPTIILGNRPKKTDKIILIEDGVASAGQSKKFIENMKKEGYVIQDILAIFDVLEGKGEHAKLDFLEEYNVKLHYLFRFREYLDYILENQLISSEYHAIILDWIHDPSAWGEASIKWEWYREEKRKGNIWLKYSREEIPHAQRATVSV